MKYYQHIQIPNVNEIIDATRNYIVSNDAIYNRRSGVCLIHLGKNLPFFASLIESCLDKYNLVCTGAYAFVISHQNQCSVHSDSFIHESRLNIPILNCEYSETKFYDVSKWKTCRNMLGHDVPVALEYVEVDSVKITEPTLLRVNKPHKVILNKELDTPRITLSLYFDRDPLFLIWRFK